MADYCATDFDIFRHRLPVQMRFNDIDMLGHLNNSIYFSFMDLAKTRYFQAALGDKLKFGTIGVVIVNVNCDFCSQTFFDDEIEVLTATTKIGDKSLRLEQLVVGVEDKVVRCRCTTIMAGFDHRTHGSCPISDEWRTALESYEGRKLSSL